MATFGQFFFKNCASALTIEILKDPFPFHLIGPPSIKPITHPKSPANEAPALALNVFLTPN